MKRNGFSLIEILVVLAILAIIFGMSSVIGQSLDLTTQIVKQNKQYEEISQLYNSLSHLDNAIAINNDFSNNQFLYQLPFLDVQNKIADPLQGGDWYAIKYQDEKLFKVNQGTGEKIQLSPADVIIKSSTFNFDNNNKQLRIALDLLLKDSKNSTRINMSVNMINVLNKVGD